MTFPKFTRWPLVAVIVVLLVVAGLAVRSWYGGSRDWQSTTAVPLFTAIEPADGATVYASDAWIRWTSTAPVKGRVIWRREGSRRTQSADARNGHELLAHLAPLSAESKYEYIVEEDDGNQVRRSAIRTLNVQSGLAFEPVVDQTIEHDYDQTVKLTLRNRGSQKITIAARALKQFDDLPADMTGYGTRDVPAELAPNSSVDLRLAVTAADAIQETYEIPVEAAGAFVAARFHVRMPKLDLTFKVTGENLNTLAKTLLIFNNGDSITDLSLHPVQANQQDLELEPAVHHARLAKGASLTLVVRPVLYLEFERFKGEIEATAAGQSLKFPLEFTPPPGAHLIAFRSASGGASSCRGGYCTNRPNTCTDCGSPPGTGPAEGPDPPLPKPGKCEPCKPDKNKLCSTLASADQVARGMVNWTGSFSWESKGSAQGLHMPTGDEWNKTLASGKPKLTDLLQQALDQLCDNKPALESLDGMLKTLDSLNPSQPKSPKDVLSESLAVAGISFDLEKLMDSLGCNPPKHAPSPETGPCPEGTKEKDKSDNEALKQVWEGLKGAYEKLKEETDDLDKAQPEVGSSAAEKLNVLKEKLEELKKAKEYVEMIQAARCVPPDVLSWFKRVMEDEQAHTDPSADCNNLCAATADWVKKMSGTSDFQKKVFTEACMNFCGGVPHVPKQ